MRERDRWGGITAQKIGAVGWVWTPIGGCYRTWSSWPTTTQFFFTDRGGFTTRPRDREEPWERLLAGGHSLESFLRLWGGSSMILLRSPRSCRSMGLSQTDSWMVGLKKNTLSSPVQTTHLREKGLEIHTRHLLLLWCTCSVRTHIYTHVHTNTQASIYTH